jgi:hypothetical protein
MTSSTRGKRPFRSTSLSFGPAEAGPDTAVTTVRDVLDQYFAGVGQREQRRCVAGDLVESAAGVRSEVREKGLTAVYGRPS